MKKALIVDDEENARLYLANILYEIYPELEVQMAASPAEAILILTKQRVDVIFLDVEMPEMSGLEMLKQIREQIKETPVIFVSSYKRAEFIQNAMRLNAIDYIDKPVDYIELSAALDKSFNIPNKQNKTDKFQKLKLYTERGELLFEPNEVLYFESNKRYAVAHFVNGYSNVIVRDNLKSLEKILPENIFQRVSRQCIINLNYIKFTSKSNLTITMSDGFKTLIIEKVFPYYFKKP